MMKKHVWIFWALIIIAGACKNDSICRTSGKIIRQNFFPPPFENLRVNKNLEVVIQKSNTPKISIEADENLIPYFDFTVSDNTLILSFQKNCLLRNERNRIKVFLSAPQIKEIHQSSEYDILSRDTLDFPELKLISENYNDPGSPAVGNFDLIVDCQRLEIISNNLSLFKISGKTDLLSVGFYAGISKLDAQNLVAKRIFFLQRSANDMKLFPVHILKGDIYSVGNVLIFNEPDTLQVTEHYTGKLIRNY